MSKTSRSTGSLLSLRSHSPYIALIMLYTALGQAAEVQGMGSPRPAQCEAPTALIMKIKACDRLVTAQDLSISNLKASNTKLSNKIVELTAPPLLPGWVIPIGMFILGVFAGSRLK